MLYLTKMGFVMTLLVASLGGEHVKIGPCVLVIKPTCPDPTIKFYLYTRLNKFDPDIVTVENITNSKFQPAQPNKLIVHGFNSNWKLSQLQQIKNEYIENADVNVWMIDYALLSAGPLVCYPAAVYNLPSVGKCATDMVKAILEHSEAIDPADKMHLLGFSLGAHLTSQISFQLAPTRLSRITGLDPALPLFYSWNRNRQLSKADADFVDVVHTNALVEGQLKPSGHVDFYVNGGTSQPACVNASNPIKCNHHMAPEYFAESINTEKGFWAWECSNVSDYYDGKCPPKGKPRLMGEFCKTNSSGLYVLNTEKKPPYAKGKWSEVQSAEYFF
ncbi:pancreatic lipase-related protein 2-like [Adelges cooleyi]|uniref:pancreatic lipase-related protein 2-like n=1 Tax=Adelges cooleyi TaxID=133065 RepID=UPI00217FA354|nr:pancreatic lipase-related protein 2-like [Adelges cooleyi]XP_050441502.1 pancreatic lipase-related protein 2-like [Adelges cooleyi]XP_050441503.1 pancreatic lipase-related protein 2-like [Adelges cooleyi]XP_050441504.1 pancreatic lipase-related protein 2-like [Adelges cooleyi]